MDVWRITVINDKHSPTYTEDSNCCEIFGNSAQQQISSIAIQCLKSLNTNITDILNKTSTYMAIKLRRNAIIIYNQKTINSDDLVLEYDNVFHNLEYSTCVLCCPMIFICLFQ